MAIRPFLAMTAAEVRDYSDSSEKIAWMACHFSPYSSGLSNLPRFLPPGSLLVVDDMTPPHGHDPRRIAQQLTERLEALGCAGVLLDLQRPGDPETAVLVEALSQALPCPFAVSDLYAKNGAFPVFLPPVPPSVPLKEHLAPWEGREIWLDVSRSGEVICITEQGAVTAPLTAETACGEGFAENALHCHYQIHLTEEEARFALWRTREDLEQHLEEAQKFGIATTVGLYQELRDFV